MILFLLTLHTSTITIIICSIAGILLLRYIILKIEKQRAQYRHSKKVLKGLKEEKRAAKLLEQHGYTVREFHPKVAYTLHVDNSSERITLELDYIVEKNNKKYVAEVKSGEHTSSILYAPTRRQLLEYAVATDFDGYLLVQTHTNTIQEIRFPISKKRAIFIPLLSILQIILAIVSYIISKHPYVLIVALCILLTSFLYLYYYKKN